jgi:hypothetical protein
MMNMKVGLLHRHNHENAGGLGSKSKPKCKNENVGETLQKRGNNVGFRKNFIQNRIRLFHLDTASDPHPDPKV